MAPLMPLPGWNPPFQPLEKTPRAGARDPSCSQSASHRSPGYHSGHSNVRFWMWYGCDTGLHDVPRCSDFSDFPTFPTIPLHLESLTKSHTDARSTHRLTGWHRHIIRRRQRHPVLTRSVLHFLHPLQSIHHIALVANSALHHWSCGMPAGAKKELHGDIKGRKFVSEPFSCNTADEDASSTNNASPLPSEQRCWRIPCPWCRIWWQHLNHWAARWYKAKHPQIHRFLPPMPW